jgi:molecular chaperone DnaK (HSP70)
LTVCAQAYRKTGLETSIVIEGSAKLLEFAVDRIVQETESFLNDDRMVQKAESFSNDDRIVEKAKSFSNITQMVQEAKSFVKENKKPSELILAKNAADLLIYNTNKQIENLDTSILESQKNKISELNILINDLNTAVEKDDAEQIKNYTENVQSIIISITTSFA